jgi:transcriptional regulator with XRE-family HTH domain
MNPVLDLKSARQKAGLNQTELAKLVGISNKRYQHYECGRRQPDNNMVLSLANALGVTPNDLFGVIPSLDENVIKKEPTPREELLLMLDHVPDDKLDKFKAVLLAAIDAVK